MAQTHPLNGKLVLVTGGTGFLGNYVAQALLECGARLRVAGRHPEKARDLKPLANLGQLQLARVDLTNERSVEAAVQGVDAVVNLVGSFEGDLMKLMGESAGMLAEKAKAAGASAFVQVSAIAADLESEADYSRAKALGEKLVLEAFPKATILRPSIIFGKDDNFLNMFAGLIRTFPVLPVFAPEAKLQLVYVDDVAEAVRVALADPKAHGGKTYELGGPEQVSMMEINERIAEAQGRKRTFLPMPDAASGAFAALPGTPMSSDQWTLLKQGNVVSGEYPGFDKLGIEPRPLGLFLEKWMVRYRKHGRFTGRVKMA
ncbi:complex I NDUFA9 subunit family protein [Erythrobacter sp. HKB08]|uniref:complex I NDUFA9 subunit family protein n=1 Tax=Erythrobacter sp. HKB08 TaxID=2502843 RepID=UPI001008A93A|nr:complex I NDUFA9 subunit family protein [Erythrobacter sp. HKB08]